MKKFAWLFVLAASVLWGAMGIVTRYVAGIGFPTRQTAAVRICSAAACLVLFLLLTDRGKLKIEKKDVKWFLGTGLGSLLINNLCYAEVVQRASLSVAVVLLYTAPFFVMILSLLFFHEKLTLQKVCALFLSFSGCALVVGISEGNAGEEPVMTLIIGLVTGLAYGLYYIYYQRAFVYVPPYRGEYGENASCSHRKRSYAGAAVYSLLCRATVYGEQQGFHHCFF